VVGIKKVKHLLQQFKDAHRLEQDAEALDNQLTNGGEDVSPLCNGHPLNQDDSWNSFLLEAESTPGPCAARRIRLDQLK
jgi:hypothetical protein